MAADLRRDLAFADGDATYQKLIDAIGPLDDAEAMKAMAKLILLLANHIGDEALLDAALKEVAAKKRDTGKHDGETGSGTTGRKELSQRNPRK